MCECHNSDAEHEVAMARFTAARELVYAVLNAELTTELVGELERWMAAMEER